jgi:hypothetical protein
VELINKILGFLVGVCRASIISLAVMFVAHYEFGLSRLEIRTSALKGAAMFALIFALLMAPVWFGKKFK